MTGDSKVEVQLDVENGTRCIARRVTYATGRRKRQDMHDSITRLAPQQGWLLVPLMAVSMWQAEKLVVHETQSCLCMYIYSTCSKICILKIRCALITGAMNRVPVRAAPWVISTTWEDANTLVCSSNDSVSK